MFSIDEPADKISLGMKGGANAILRNGNIIPVQEVVDKYNADQIMIRTLQIRINCLERAQKRGFNAD